jgi:hypothetical protein
VQRLILEPALLPATRWPAVCRRWRKSIASTKCPRIRIAYCGSRAVGTAAAENAELVRRGYEAFNAGDLAALGELFAEDAVWYAAGSGVLSGKK